MKHLNQFFLRGILGKDPEVKTVGSKGSKIAKFSVAYTRNWKDDNGEWQNETTWFNVTSWGRMADAAEKLQKGSAVQVEGTIKITEHEGKYYTEVVADNLTEVVNPRVKAKADTDTYSAKSRSAEDDEDIPF